MIRHSPKLVCSHVDLDPVKRCLVSSFVMLANCWVLALAIQCSLTASDITDDDLLAPDGQVTNNLWVLGWFLLWFGGGDSRTRHEQATQAIKPPTMAQLKKMMMERL